MRGYIYFSSQSPKQLSDHSSQCQTGVTIFSRKVKSVFPHFSWKVPQGYVHLALRVYHRNLQFDIEMVYMLLLNPTQVFPPNLRIVFIAPMEVSTSKTKLALVLFCFCFFFFLLLFFKIILDYFSFQSQEIEKYLLTSLPNNKKIRLAANIYFVVTDVKHWAM